MQQAQAQPALQPEQLFQRYAGEQRPETERGGPRRYYGEEQRAKRATNCGIAKNGGQKHDEPLQDFSFR